MDLTWRDFYRSPYLLFIFAFHVGSWPLRGIGPSVDAR